MSIARLAVLMLCLTVFPGCLTQALWDSGPEQVARTQLVEETVNRSEGDLLLTDAGMAWRGLAGEEVRMAPQGVAGHLAVAVLADPECCVVRNATLERTRVTCDDELIEDTLHVAMTIRVVAGSIAELMPEGQLTASARAALLDPSIAQNHLSLVQRQCAQMLRAFDFAGLVGQAGPQQVVAELFVDGDGLPMVGARRPVAEESVEAAALRERLALLSQMSLLVRLEGNGRSQIVRLRPDRLVLVSMLAGASTGTLLHRAAMEFEVVHDALDVHSSALGVGARYVQRFTHYQRVSDNVQGMSLWGKIALTPFTLALDIPLSILRACLLGGSGDDDDDGSSASSPYSSKQRSGESEQQWRQRQHEHDTRQR